MRSHGLTYSSTPTRSGALMGSRDARGAARGLAVGSRMLARLATMAAGGPRRALQARTASTRVFMPECARARPRGLLEAPRGLPSWVRAYTRGGMSDLPYFIPHGVCPICRKCRNRTQGSPGGQNPSNRADDPKIFSRICIATVAGQRRLVTDSA